MADTNLTLVSYGAGDAERLQAFADALGSFGSSLYVLLKRDGGAQFIGPLCVFKADGLGAFYDLLSVYALGVGVGFYFFKILEAVLIEHGLELGHAAFIVFKQSH